MNRLLGRLDAASNNDVVVQGASADSAQFKKMMSRLDRISKEHNPNDEAAFIAHIESMSEISMDTTSRNVINRRRRINNLWLAVVRTFEEEYPENDIWHVETVSKYLEMFLPITLMLTEPRKGHTAIRSTTLQSAFQNIMMLVCQNCFDPVTKVKAGFKLLTDTGMFVRIKKQLTGLIVKYKLERSPHVKLFYGREHVHAILKTMLTKSEKFGPVRLYILQSACRFLLTFYTTCRPSTGGPTEEKWAEAGRYPKLSDLTIHRRGYMTFEIKIRLSNFKGAISTVNATVQDIVLHPVMYAQNVFLDPTNWFMAFLFARGAFEKKYQTPEELYSDTDASITIDPDMLDEPLFREMSIGGRGFSNRMKPASANSATKAFGRACVEAGLPKQGMYSMRRDGGNAYYHQLGRQAVRLLMNHSEDIGVLEQDYLRGPSDFDLVPIRLGEMAGPQESRAGQVLEKSRAHHLFSDVLVESILRFEGKSVKDLKREKREERIPKVNANAKVLEVTLDIENIWREYRKCFTFQASNYDLCTKGNVTRIYKAAQREGKVIEFREGSETKAVELRKQLRECFDIQTTVRREVNRVAVVEDERQMSLSFFKNALTGSTEERDQVMENLRGEGLDHVKEVLRGAMDVDDDESDDDDNEPVADEEAGEDDEEEEEEEEEDDDDDDDDDDITPEMLEEYRNITGHQGDTDPCKFQGNIKEWDKNLRRELLLEEMDIEEEEDGSSLPKEFSFIENMAEAKAKQSGVNLEAASLEVEGLSNQPKDLDESLETDVFGLNPGEVRRIFFDLLLKPILWERSIRVEGENGKKTYPCEICHNYVGPTPFLYTRHKNTNHSPWKELEMEMEVYGQEMLVCPYGPCDFEADSVRKVVHHMTDYYKDGSDKCANAEEYRRLKAEHAAATPVDHRIARKLKARSKISHVIPATNPDLIGLNNALASYAGDEDISDPQLVTTTSADWRSLQTVDFLGMDFDDFRSEAMDVDKNVTFVEKS